MFSRSRKPLFLSVLAFLVLAALPACSAQNSSADLHMLPLAGVLDDRRCRR